MSEKVLRRRVLRALKPLHAVPVENCVGVPGTPDITYAHGWIELKKLAAWPVGVLTPCRVPKYTDHQREWHKRRHAAGGLCWVLLQVGNSDWLLLAGNVAAANLGYVSRSRLTELAHAHWRGPLKRAELDLLEIMRNARSWQAVQV